MKRQKIHLKVYSLHESKNNNKEVLMVLLNLFLGELMELIFFKVSMNSLMFRHSFIPLQSEVSPSSLPIIQQRHYISV